MPTASTYKRPSSTSHPEKDALLKTYEEQLALLPSEAKEFCRQHFSSHTDLIPWILREKDTRELHCEGQMRRDMAFFIAKIRIRLEASGDLHTIRQEAAQDAERPKTLVPRIKALWHSLTTAVSLDDNYDDFMEKVARIHDSLDKSQKDSEEPDGCLEQQESQDEKWRREQEEETKRRHEEHQKLMEEFKKAEDRLKELEEEWKGIQEARRQRQEEWERQWEERRTRDEEREKERRRLEGRRKILEDLEKWKEEKRREAGYGLEVSDAEEDEGQQYLSFKWRKWEWDSINEEYLRRQYHDLICVFPYQVRRTLISIIPTLDDLREKTNEYTTFSGTLRHKYELDQFIEIFRFINNEYPFQITDIGFLYQQMTGRQPHHDLTLEESITLRLLENTPKKEKRERLLRNHHPCHPSPSGYYRERCFDTYLMSPGDAVLCEQKETAPPPQLDELFCMDTAYPDFIILAVTLVQAAREVDKKLHALRRFHGYYDNYSIASLSDTRIHLYASCNEPYFTYDLYLTKKGGRLYLSHDEGVPEKMSLNLNARYFDELRDLEREFQQWLDRLRTVLLRLSGDRLVVYSDFYKIRVFDKSNQRSCSLYTLTSWIEAHDIHEVARDYHVNESPMKHHPWKFPGKYHY